MSGSETDLRRGLAVLDQYRETMKEAKMVPVKRGETSRGEETDEPRAPREMASLSASVPSWAGLRRSETMSRKSLSARLFQTTRFHGRLASIRRYWLNPPADTTPDTYLQGAERTAFLVSEIESLLPKDASVLEVGCNVGRNLHALFEAGFRDLRGLDINPEALALAAKTFPEMGKTTLLFPGLAEDLLPKMPSGSLDLIFTMNVLMHIPPRSEGVFREMARMSRRFLVTVEDEVHSGWDHVPRDYGRVFRALGFRQDRVLSCESVPGLGPAFMLRVLKKEFATQEEKA